MNPAQSATIRRANPEDAADIAFLAAVTFPLACPPDTSRESMALHIQTELNPVKVSQWIARDNGAVLVAESAGQISGYAMVVVAEPANSDEAEVVRAFTGVDGPYRELSKIYVSPATQGTSAAAELMSATVLASESLAGGAKPMWLGTNQYNHRAQAFYRKMGFVKAGERSYNVGGGVHSDVVMVLESAGGQ